MKDYRSSNGPSPELRHIEARAPVKAAQFKSRIESDPAASFWLKAALEAAFHRDALDALADAQALLVYCHKRADEALKG